MAFPEIANFRFAAKFVQVGFCVAAYFGQIACCVPRSRSLHLLAKPASKPHRSSV
jgi:hypothetical protein